MSVDNTMNKEMGSTQSSHPLSSTQVPSSEVVMPLSEQQQQQQQQSTTISSPMQQHRPSMSTTSTIPSTAVASLIQSAAKLSFDAPLSDHFAQQHPPHHNHQVHPNNTDKLFQDDEYDGFVHSLFVAVTTTPQPQQQQKLMTEAPPPPSLQSLQQATLPVLPDEQDRKRFVGCLAAVIVSMYEYDTIITTPTTTTTSSSGMDRSNQQINHGPNNDLFVNDDDNDDPMHNDMSQSFYYEDDADDENFDYFEDVSEEAQKRPSRPSSYRNTSVSASASASMSGGGSVSTGGGGPLSVLRRGREATLRAQTRHRRRRYDIFCRFLLSATEQLGLEKGHGRCFLPILERLLVPAAVSTTSTTTTTTGTSSVISSQRRPSFSSETTTTTPIVGGSCYDDSYLQRQMDETKDLRPFLEGLGPGAGIRCIAMLLLQHLLNASNGYDARIRHVMKTVGVLVIMHDLVLDQHEEQLHAQQQQQQNQNFVPANVLKTEGDTNVNKTPTRPEIYPTDMLTLATRKFESLEHCLATKLIQISAAQQQQQRTTGGKHGSSSAARSSQTSAGSFTSRGMGGSARDKFLRGLKIGGTAVAAGTLFAITGGLGRLKF
jgi:hypothetical protein